MCCPPPQLVFVERKTHRDSWTGNLSAKERFTLLPADVPALLQREPDLVDNPHVPARVLALHG